MAEEKTDTNVKSSGKSGSKHRIYQIAKELNLSHEEIITFLEKNEIAVKSHMSPVDDDVYNKILAEFAKEKVLVEREKSESIQREQEVLRKMEKDLEKKKVDTHVPMPHEIPLVSKIKNEEKDAVAIPETTETEAVQIPDKLQTEKKSVPSELKDIEQPDSKAIEKSDQSGLIDIEEGDDIKSDQPVDKIETSLLGPEVKKISKKKKSKSEKSSVTDVQSQQDIKRRRKRIRVRKSSDVDIESKIAETPHRRRRGQPVDAKEVKDSIKKTLAGLEASKSKKKRKKAAISEDTEVDAYLIKVPEFTSVGDLASLMDVPTNELIAKCMSLGYMVTINQRLDFDTIILLADEFDYRVEKEEEFGADVVARSEADEKEEDMMPRAPIVTIMGHVDHGKTSLLDYIRDTNVAAGESGGITQHIGAYRVQPKDDREITFLDTPGHEAFTAMRARGAQVTDIVVLVIAADDGVKPQTIEAISHAKAAEVPIVVAINKIDKAGSDPENVKRELSEHKVMVESWGGKVQSIEVSAKNGDGIDDLLEALLLEADLLELKANPKVNARGIVVEANLDKGLGPVGTVLIQKGTLRVGDHFICGTSSGKVRGLLNERNQRVEETKPSVPVQVLGFESVPTANDYFAVLEEERDVKKISSERKRIKREQDFRKIKLRTLDEISQQIKEGKVRELSIIIKGDVDGSVEALTDSLNKLSTKEVAIKVIHQAVGTIIESDILLATASGAVIIGFHVNASAEAKKIAERDNIDIRLYDVIYDAVNEIKTALEGLLEPEQIVEVVGRIEIRMVFKNSKIGSIAGCYVESGKVSRGDSIRLLRDDEIIDEGTINSLKRFKDDVKEVAEGFECGITIGGVEAIQEGDLIQVIEVTSRKRTLEEARK